MANISVNISHSRERESTHCLNTAYETTLHQVYGSLNKIKTENSRGRLVYKNPCLGAKLDELLGHLPVS